MFHNTEVSSTGKSLLEALILASTNPQYDKRLSIDLPVQYMKTTSSEHVVYIHCFLFVFILTFKKDNFSYSKIRFFSSKQEILNILIFDASLAWLL